MSELLPLENEKEKYEYYNNILILKESIKSDIIKKMLEEEDTKEKEDKNIDNIINKISNKKKTNNNKENKDKNNSYHFPLIKIYPKSRTIRNLLIEKPKKKKPLKTNKKKKIKDEKEEKEEKDNVIKYTKANKKPNNNEDLNLMFDKTENKLNLNDKYNNNIDVMQRNLSPNIQKQKNIFLNEGIKDDIKKEICHSEEKPNIQKHEYFTTNESISIKKDENSKKSNEKINLAKKSIYDEINLNIKKIYNNNRTREKSIQDFDAFISDNNSFEYNYSPKIQKTLNIFKKGNKYIKKYIYLPKYPNYSSQEIIKVLIFKDILSFLSPIERYVFSKTNKQSLVNYMKSKGAENEILLDKYKKQKEEIEKILNKNPNIKITKENFFNDNRLCQIFNLLDDSKYLEIFNDKTKVPDDNIIFVFKLFFLLIKGTDKLIELKNDIFWEKISTYFINHTNEFNSNDYLLGELVKKMLEQKIDFSEGKIRKIQDIIDQVDPRQLNPGTFKDISPTTAQFCYIIGYFMEFFGIIDKEWNPLETEYKELNAKINDLIKKINKIGLYIVNLKYKSQFK